MSNSDLNTSMKYENTNLQEDLIFYKSQNLYFRTKIQDLEDEMRTLKDKLKKATFKEKNTEDNYPLGQHFPVKLLHL